MGDLPGSHVRIEELAFGRVQFDMPGCPHLHDEKRRLQCGRLVVVHLDEFPRFLGHRLVAIRVVVAAADVVGLRRAEQLGEPCFVPEVNHEVVSSLLLLLPTVPPSCGRAVHAGRDAQDPHPVRVALLGRGVENRPQGRADLLLVALCVAG
ncbi:hypothetical protein ACIP79_20920 [Streptomyces sp. NPDC088747]|uniref:hypothetical protein n=1 Tax=Streptomyces sp. NPDC088747 TaxID=3365886 RepID=UPI0037F64353